MRKTILYFILSFFLSSAEAIDKKSNNSSFRKSLPQTQTLSISKNITTLTLQNIKVFLSRNRIVDSVELLEKLPYVVTGGHSRVINSAGDKIYVHGIQNHFISSYNLFRRGRTYFDATTQKILGINLNYVGTANLVSLENKTATLQLTSTSQEINTGDYIFPMQETTTDLDFVPTKPLQAINGLIIDVPRGVSQFGVKDVVTINCGARDGLKEGSVLSILKSGKVIRNVVKQIETVIPDEKVGLLVIFHTHSRLSYGLVIESMQPLSVGDKVANL